MAVWINDKGRVLTVWSKVRVLACFFDVFTLFIGFSFPSRNECTTSAPPVADYSLTRIVVGKEESIIATALTATIR